MGSLVNAVIKHKKAVIVIYIVIIAVCAVLNSFVTINYDMADYLPGDAESKVAIDIMDSEFASAVPNARIMVADVSLTEALEYKARISEVPGITDIIWIDDVIDLTKPLEFEDPDTVEQYYKDGAALFSATMDDSNPTATLAEIYTIIGEDGAASGSAVGNAVTQNMAGNEVTKSMAILIPIVILLLVLTTTSWIAPLLFLLSIGAAVMINMGTNLFFGELSFITRAISPILQLAVSLDYAIFLLNSFQRFREETDDVEEAMRRAVKKSRSSIAASAATTLFGFMALIFMHFRIGSDLGLNMLKGIVLSYICVMTLFPALILSFCRLMDKTRHKRFIPQFKRVGGSLLRVRLPAILLVVILIVPCFLAQSRTSFLYGGSSTDPSTRYNYDTAKVDDAFGKETAAVLLVPRGDPGRETALCASLGDIDHVTGVFSYVTSVGASIPDGFPDENIVSKFYSENYARIVLYTDTSEEGIEAFGTVAAIRSTASESYSESYLTGQSASLYDIKDVVTSDSMKVNFIAIAFIFITLLVTFRSLTLPLILLFTIESAIWINLSIPYFTGTTLVYVGYLVINTVQLGATIDYAILITEGYYSNRAVLGARAAVEKTLGDNFISVLTSALILSSAGFCLHLVSTAVIVSELGLLLARGTLISLALVLLVLPGLLLILDRATTKLSLHSNFLIEEKKP